MSSEKIAQAFDNACRVACALTAQICLGAALVVPVGIIGWQLFTFLKAGAWPQFSVLDAWRALAEPGAPMWIDFPESWFGVHWLLASLPASLSLMAALAALGALLLAWARALD